MIFWLLNTLIVAGIMIAVTSKVPKQISSKFMYQFALGVTCWAVGYLTLFIYPSDWLHEQSITDDEYSYEDSECIKPRC